MTTAIPLIVEQLTSNEIRSLDLTAIVSLMSYWSLDPTSIVSLMSYWFLDLTAIVSLMSGYSGCQV
jgi:hypothetical protein